MKPLGKGSKRTELFENVSELLISTDVFPGMYDPTSIIPTVAVLGGAIEQALTDTFGPEFPRETRIAFWRYFHDNTWRLTRSLKASGLLKEIK